MKQGYIQTIYVCRLMLEHVVLVRYTVCLFLELCLSSWPPARKIFERALKMEKCCTTESCKHVPSQRWERDAGAVSSRQVKQTKYLWSLRVPGPGAPAETCPIFLLPPTNEPYQLLLPAPPPALLCALWPTTDSLFSPEQTATVCLERRRKRSRARVGDVTVSRCAVGAGWE